jgi:tetratricopeptide (TPR) repeat protein
VTALNSLVLAHGQAGQVDRAIGYLEAALELCSRQGDRHREAALHNNLADLLHADGRREEAMAHLSTRWRSSPRSASRAPSNRRAGSWSPGSPARGKTPGAKTGGSRIPGPPPHP